MALLVTATAATVLLASLEVGRNDVGQRIAVYGLLLALAGLAAAMICSVGRRLGTSLALGKLGVWAAASFTLFFGLSTLTWQRRLATDAPVTIMPESVVRACVVVGVCFAAFVLGYVATHALAPVRGPSRAVRRVLLQVPHSATDTSGGLRLAGIGLAATAWQIAFGQFGYLQSVIPGSSSTAQIAALLSLFTYFGLAVLYMSHLRQPRQGSGAAVVVVAATALASAFFSGTKEETALVGVALVFAHGAVRQRLPLRLLLVALVAFIAVVNPFNEAYRQEVRGSSGNLNPPAAAAAGLGVAADTASSISPDTVLNSGSQLLGRVREIDNVAIIMQRSPDTIPFRSVSELAVAPLAGVVPRLLWPSKPVYDISAQFSREYYSLPSSIRSSSAITPIGDLYRHGGLPVAVIGMLLLGVLLRIVDDTDDINESVGLLFLVLAAFPTVVKWETDIVTLLLSLPTILIAPALAVRLIQRAPKAVDSARTREGDNLTSSRRRIPVAGPT